MIFLMKIWKYLFHVIDIKLKVLFWINKMGFFTYSDLSTSLIFSLMWRASTLKLCTQYPNWSAKKIELSYHVYLERVIQG